MNQSAANVDAHSPRRETWADMFARLSAAERQAALEPSDLERLATAAYLIGRYPESVEIRTRAHNAYLARDDLEGAARAAFWLGLQMMMSGERARGGGWFARAGRLLEQAGSESAVQGFLQLPTGLSALGADEPERAADAFAAACDAGSRFGEPDLVALGRLGQGQARIRLGDVEGGVALLDEAMAAAEVGELSPMAVGVLYCALIETCQEIFDVRRATEWTAVLNAWCAAEPDLVPYRGQCLVRRSELAQLKGEWERALEEIRQACELLARPPGDPAIAAAWYQQAQLHRLRGELPEAEEAFKRAGELGWNVQPGLALLRLAQGRVEVAEAAVRRLLSETNEPLARARVLPAYIEIMLATGDLSAARTAAAELSGIADAIKAPVLTLAADTGQGAVSLAEGEPEAALTALRRAVAISQELDAPYEGARIRELIGLACRQLGDDETADIELDAARATYERLGADPDRRRVMSYHTRSPGAATYGLSPRELEVLRLVAAGETNRAIGEALSISERTVERHVSNIFNKLRVASRSAATAFAYEHELI